MVEPRLRMELSASRYRVSLPCLADCSSKFRFVAVFIISGEPMIYWDSPVERTAAMKRTLLAAVIGICPAIALAQPPQVVAPPATPAPGPAATVVVPQPAPGTQPTVIIVQQPAVCAEPAATRKSKASVKPRSKSYESCDGIKCQSFRCTAMFQWGSCRTFYNMNNWPHSFAVDP